MNTTTNFKDKIEDFENEIIDKQRKHSEGCGYKFEGVTCGKERYCSNCYIRRRKYEIKLRTIKQVKEIIDVKEVSGGGE